MAVKWVSALVAAGSLGALATANLISVPVVVNLVLVALCAGSAAVVVMVELYQRLDARLDAISDFLVSRLGEITLRLDHVEARLDRTFPPQLADASVVPISPRPARNRRAPADV